MTSIMTLVVALAMTFITTIFSAPAFAETLTVGVSSETSSIDPHYHNLGPNITISDEIFEGLVLSDENQKLYPGLAVSYEAIEETVWEIKLRKGVKFHDGSAFSADDVIFTMERAQNVPNSPSSFAQFIKGKTFKKVDDYTIHVSTNGPAPTMMYDLSRVKIISKKNGEGAATKDYNSGAAAIGTGPYKFVEWVPGDRVVFEANKDYWGKKAGFDKVIVKAIPSGAARSAAMLSGDVDFIEAVPPTDIARLDKDKNVSIHKSATSRMIYLFPDQWRDETPHVTAKDGSKIKNPFKDKRVREAVSIAINREAIVDKIMEGYAEPTGQFCPKGYTGYTNDISAPKHDAARAKKLLADAGYPDGFKLTVHGPNDRYVNDAKILEAVAQMLTRVGIETTVETMTRSVFFTRASTGADGQPEFSLFLAGWANGSGEASYTPKAMVHSYNKELGFGASNRGRYSNEEVDKYIQEAVQTIDESKRLKLIEDATRISLKEDVALIPIHFQLGVWATKKGYKYRAGADESTRISRIYK